MRTLPVIKTLNHAVKSTTDNIGFAFHISWPWMLMLLPLNVVTNLYLVFNGLQPDARGYVDPALVGKLFAVVAPLSIASIIAYASIAVSWHRYILLDEIPEGWKRLRIDSLMWRYIGNFILMVLLVAACAIGAGLGIALAAFILTAIVGETLSIVIVVPAILFMYSYAIIAGYRLSVKLPAVALGRMDFRMGDAWRATEGNMWRLLGLLTLLILCLLLVGVAMFAITFIFNKFGAVGLSLSVAVQVMVNWVATILGVTMLTSLYGLFVESREF